MPKRSPQPTTASPASPASKKPKADIYYDVNQLDKAFKQALNNYRRLHNEKANSKFDVKCDNLTRELQKISLSYHTLTKSPQDQNRQLYLLQYYASSAWHLASCILHSNHSQPFAKQSEAFDVFGGLVRGITCQLENIANHLAQNGSTKSEYVQRTPKPHSGEVDSYNRAVEAQLIALQGVLYTMDNTPEQGNADTVKDGVMAITECLASIMKDQRVAQKLREEAKNLIADFKQYLPQEATQTDSTDVSPVKPRDEVAASMLTAPVTLFGRSITETPKGSNPAPPSVTASSLSA